jgi:quinol monooxygenase YgiN
MIRLFVRHPVTDFAHWKRAYDDFDEERSGMGVKSHAVYQALDDANDVTVWHDFESMEAAQAFMGSARLKEVMAGAGVAGEPTVWFTQPA